MVFQILKRVLKYCIFHKMKTIQGWRFNNSYTLLPEVLYSKQSPVPVSSPKLVVFNEILAQTLNLEYSQVSAQTLSEVFSGNNLPEGATPIAQAYAGHQFGHFTILGDGRAILLGEQLSTDDRRWDIQLKGAGRTIYSRGGDGRAALGPMLREYMMSEAMHALGIPTTRSLAVVETGENVQRNSFLPGAVLTRVASSHIRVGTFEYLRLQDKSELIKILVEYTIHRHFPEINDGDNPALSLLQAVIERQAQLITDWWRVGFIHGVMNTDNMSIAGETIDYGPCAFMNAYNPATVFSSIDRNGRYSFENQPSMAQWNLARFAEALLPLIHSEVEQAVALAQGAMTSFGELFEKYWLNMMRKKLGLLTEEKQDQSLINELLSWMQSNKADYTNTFRSLSLSLTAKQEIFSDKSFLHWYQQWLSRLDRQPHSFQESVNVMQAHNPTLIPRNHKVEEALQLATDARNFSAFHRMLQALSQPYVENPCHKEYQMVPEDGDDHYQTFCGT